jgi:hypothetical protein
VRLPNADQVVVADAKVRDYLLSPSHPVGRFKSSFFAALGFTVANWEDLREAFLSLARSAEADPGQISPYGQKYDVRGTFGSSGLSRYCLDDTRRSRICALRHRVSRIGNMYKLLDTVVLDCDLPEHGLRRGDLGAVVDLHEPDGLEVEFVLASGRTQALLTLNAGDVRAVGDGDLIAVRDRSA